MKVYLMEIVYINESGFPDVYTSGVYATEDAARKVGEKRGLEESGIWPTKWEHLSYFHIREEEVQE